jgi:hypothetical protein
MEMLRISTEGLRTTFKHCVRVCRARVDAWGSLPHAVPVDKKNSLDDCREVQHTGQALSYAASAIYINYHGTRIPHGSY